MIVQGTNSPIKVVFDSSVSTMQKIVATLWSAKGGTELKRWDTEDITIGTTEQEGDTIYLPLLEDETKDYPKGKVVLEIKGLNEGGTTVFWQEVKIAVKERRDKIVDLDEGA